VKRSLPRRLAVRRLLRPMKDRLIHIHELEDHHEHERQEEEAAAAADSEEEMTGGKKV
jgi:hypothetical protein